MSDRYTPDDSPFDEDAIPAWLQKQQEDAERAEALALKQEKRIYRAGEQVGSFLFVKYMKARNRAIFACPDCGRKFQYNVYTIKQKKRCKWYKKHTV